MLNFKEVILDNFGGIKLKANVDEKQEEIIAAILYNDHGDDFLIVKATDHTSQYGYWLNRKGHADYNDVIKNPNHYERECFERLPELTGPPDEGWSSIKNDIYKTIELHMFEEKYNGWGYDKILRTGLSKYHAEFNLEWIYNDIKRAFETGVVYHCDKSYTIDRIYRFIEKNDIATEENLQKVKELETFLRIGAIDGTAGKKFYENDFVHGDDIQWIWYKGKQIHKKYHKHGIKVKREWLDDEWGGYGFYLSLNQFTEVKA